MRIHLLCIHKRVSGECTRDLCMLWAREPRGQGPKKAAGPVPGPGPLHFLVPGPWFPGPGHAQECCACTRDLMCIHKRFLCVYTREILTRWGAFVCLGAFVDLEI